jgi:hypothetical protein
MSETEKPSDAPTEAAKQSDAPTETVKQPEEVTFAEFLEDVPPSQQRKVTKLVVEKKYPSGSRYYELATPELQLHCSSVPCNGLRFFRFSEGEIGVSKTQTRMLTYMTYTCSNCRRTKKMFSIYAVVDADWATGTCYKFGEFPAYGPPTPARLIKLFEGERENFLKGRRCESQGLGIGAFSYYRRVVENQKNRILDEVIRVCEKIGTPPELKKVLEQAKTEVQFSKALDDVKGATPQTLLVNGHNPFTLLHRALSRGLHAQTDEECLAIAHDVRVVLVELAERLGQALKDEAEIDNAIKRLLARKVED